MNKKLSPKEVAELLAKSKKHKFRKQSQAVIDQVNGFKAMALDPNSALRKNHTKKFSEKYSVEVYNEKDNTYTTYPTRHEAARQTGISSMSSQDRWFPADGSWHQGSHERKGWWTRQIIKGIPRPPLPEFQHHFGHNIQIKKPNGVWKTYTSISEAARSTGWSSLDDGRLSKYNNGDIYCSKAGPFKGWQVKKNVI